MVVRLHFIVEGQTEETFVNSVLGEHLGNFSVSVDARCVMTSMKRGKKHKGGVSTYSKAKNDIINWMKSDQNSDAYFTTMFDLYRLPRDFPGYPDQENCGQRYDPYDRVQALEASMKDDISRPRFIPYLQLHEFEALLLADPRRFAVEFHERDVGIGKLIKMAATFDSPELINDSEETAPSKRIINSIPEYRTRKSSAGSNVANSIGLPTLRSKCSHFGAWLDTLESLAYNQ